MTEIDPVRIRGHVELLHRLAAPLASVGKLIVACFGQDPHQADPKTGKSGRPLKPTVFHINIGDIDRTLRALNGITQRANYNVYMPLAVLRTDLERGRKGEENDIKAVLGLVADFDDADAHRWTQRLPIAPNYVLETSVGRFQTFYLFDRPEPLQVVKPIAEQLKVFADCDHGTGDCSHVWRIAGTLNWPNARKIAAGRAGDPQLVKAVQPWNGSTVSLADLAAALPAPKRNGHDIGRKIGSTAKTSEDHTTGSSRSDAQRSRTEAAENSYAMIQALVSALPRRVHERITQPASGDRSRDLYYVINALIARELDDVTIEQIIRHHGNGIGAKYARRTDLYREITRIREKRCRREAAEADPIEARRGGRPVIKVWSGELPAIVDQAETVLIEHDPDLYEFGDELVRPAIQPIRIASNRSTCGLRLVPVGINNLIERLTYVADFQRFDKRSQEFISIDCPKSVAATYLERIGARQLRKLTAITTCPVLRYDGTVLDKPGFDELTGILYDPRGVVYPAIPTAPTRAEAQAALAELKLLFSEFPFVDGPSRSVALSGTLTVVSRTAVSFAPMHAFDAPSAGTGKSKLVDCCSIIATGHEVPVIAQGKTEEEMEKRLGAALIAGHQLISLDNCKHPQRLVDVRVLGKSKLVTVPNSALFFATGNNLLLMDDMPRRAVIGRLDAGTERPELREFTTEDPVTSLKRERARYVATALTALRAFVVAGAPEQTKPLGSFEEWSRLVRDALIWLGEPDPVDTMERVREQDPQRAALAAVLEQWNAIVGTKRASAKELIDYATDSDPMNTSPDRRRFRHSEFREALLAVAGDAGNINSRRLGIWLSANKQKVVNGLRIIADGISEGIARYRLQRLVEGRWE
jgi:hypothetical protein